MNYLNLKNKMNSKLLDKLVSPGTGKGGLSYISAIALESLESTDKFSDDLDKFSKSVRNKLLSIDSKSEKAITLPIKRTEGKIPVLSKITEINDMLLCRSVNGQDIQLFASRDSGLLWETIINIRLSSDGKLDLNHINQLGYNGDSNKIGFSYNNNNFYVVWATNEIDGYRSVNMGKIVDGTVIEIEEIYKISTDIHYINLNFDQNNRPLITFGQKSQLGFYEPYALFKIENTVWRSVLIQSVNISASAYLAKNVHNVDGKMWVTVRDTNKLYVASLDLGNIVNNEYPEITIYNSTYKDADPDYVGSFYVNRPNKKGFLITRSGFECVFFDLNLKQFSRIENLVAPTKRADIPFVCNRNGIVISGNDYTVDFGNTWTTTHVKNTLHDVNYSACHASTSSLSNHIIMSHESVTSYHVIYKIEDLCKENLIIDL